MTRTATLLTLFLALITLPGCEVIGTIFEVGFWLGVIIVVVVLVLVFGLIRMLGRGRKRP